MPKGGQGSLTPFVELHFDGQKFRTTTKEKDLHPVWDKTFYFNISDPLMIPHLNLDACIYYHNRATNSRSFHGKVSLSGTSFVPHSDAVVLHYPLEKRGLFSRINGEIGLKVYITNDPTIKSSTPDPTINAQANVTPKSEVFPNKLLIVSCYQEVQEMKMKAEAPPPRIVRMHSASASQPVDFALKETSPYLGGGRVIGGRIVHADKTASTYDLVERMQFLYVRVVKARDLLYMDLTGSLDPFVEVQVGNYKGVTKHLDKNDHLEWNVVFAFSRDRLQASGLEVKVKDKDLIKDDFVGIVRFDLHEVPTRVPPDSPLAPQWCRLKDKKGEKVKGELMLAVCLGTQADEPYSEAWHSDTAGIDIQSSATSALLRSKVYHAPRLWHVRVNVIEAQDLVPTDKTRFPEVFCKAQIGHQIMRTKPMQARTLNSFWNEDLLFVAAEPFADHLVLTVEDRVAPGKDEILGRIILPLTHIDRRADDRIFPSRWFHLEKPISVDVDQLKKEKFATRLHLRVFLDGGYHVLDESTHYSSDLRPTAKQLWKPTIGVDECDYMHLSWVFYAHIWSYLNGFLVIKLQNVTNHVSRSILVRY